MNLVVKDEKINTKAYGSKTCAVETGRTVTSVTAPGQVGLQTGTQKEGGDAAGALSVAERGHC